jgi:hypothetical protein
MTGPLLTRDRAGARKFAADWLRRELADGPRPVVDVMTAMPPGLTTITLKRAKQLLGVESVREGFGPGGSWTWKLRGELDPLCDGKPSEERPRDLSRNDHDDIEAVRLTSEEREWLRAEINRRQREHTREPNESDRQKADRALFRGDVGFVGIRPSRAAQLRLAQKRKRAKK